MYIIIVSRTHYSVLFVIKMEKIFELHSFLFIYFIIKEVNNNIHIFSEKICQ